MAKFRLSVVADLVIGLSVATCVTSLWAVEFGKGSPNTGIFARRGLPTADLPSLKSSPKDTNSYSRPAIPADAAGPTRRPPTRLLGAQFNITRVVDTVVNNTDPNLKNTDTFNDGEPSIAINPLNPNEIAITAFSGSWGANAPLWHSTDAGQTWSKLFTIPVPPGAGGTAGCPCDQVIDFGADGTLFGVFLTFSPDNVYTGSTSDATSSAAWKWWISGAVAQETNLVGTSKGNADQPWLLHNRGTTSAASENVFVGYDDFGVGPVGMRVSRSINLEPPQFDVDAFVGSETGGGINPGHRLATDPRNGWVYSLHQNCTANCGGSPKTISYQLNRSTDQGSTWTLNGSATGVVVASGVTVQPTPKFGTVNALLGGIDHATVDPATGDVYVVYGGEDGGGNSTINIRRLNDNGAGGLTIGPANVVATGTGAGTTALPSVAVTQQGSNIGVFYYTFNGIVSGFPQFSTWLAVSNDQGTTFNTQLLKTFLSPAMDNGNPRQRVFGDYVQIKSIGQCFDGTFTGNGAAFGRAASNNDPIFYQACVQPVTFSSLTGSLAISSYQPLFNITLNLAGAIGINPPFQTTTLQINTFTLTIPPGSFTPAGPGKFSFNGTVNGVSVSATITQTGATSYTFQASANPNLSRTRPDPATVTLTIGSDSGTTSLPF
jgi:hypothetical protein